MKLIGYLRQRVRRAGRARMSERVASPQEGKWEAERRLLNEACDKPPCTAQSCLYCGCAKLLDRLDREYHERMRPKWRESKRRQRERKRHIAKTEALPPK